MVAFREVTFGEKYIESLLEKLTQQGYFYAAEHRISTQNGDLYPDFVLVCPQRGVLVIEVKDYVELMPGSTAKELIIRRRDGMTVTVPNPQETARDYALALQDQFKHRANLLNASGKLAFPWQHIVAFPNLDRAQIRRYVEQGIFSAGMIWAKQDLNSVETLLRAMENIPWRFALDAPMNDAVLNTLRGVLNPTLIVHDAAGQDVGTLTVLQEILSTEALKVTESTSVRLVRGVAGSGKSLVLMRRALHLAQTYPDMKILIMTFNAQLADYVQRRLNNPNIEVRNFHKQCAQIFKGVNKRWREPSELIGWLQHHQYAFLAEYGMTPDFADAEIRWRKEMRIEDNEAYLMANRKGRGVALPRERREVINVVYDAYRLFQSQKRERGQSWADWDDIPHQALEILERKDSPHRQRYDVIMLDEAQDFAPVWLDVTKAQLKPGGTLFLCDDPTQSLFRYYSWQEKGVPVSGRTRVLRVPFRNTRQITQAAHALVQADALISQSEMPLVDLESAELVDGLLPLVQGCRDDDSEIAFVAAKVRELLHQQGDMTIGILCNSHRMVKHWAALRSPQVTVESFGKIKGLEFDVVLVPFVCRTFISEGAAVDEQFVANKRREIFMAMTRARKLLIMSYHAAFPAELTALIPHIYHESC